MRPERCGAVGGEGLGAGAGGGGEQRGRGAAGEGLERGVATFESRGSGREA